MSRAGSLLLLWDYDTAIGQVNASYPYNYHEERHLEEISNVDRILELGASRKLKMTFACVGFAAETGHFPYHVPEQIRRIREASHEIASHSWRHEWFPFLTKEQVRRSLARSKLVLEQCIGEAGAVRGFVPPFSRPMTWYRKGALSLGDRSLTPFRAGGNIGSLCSELRDAGYSWCRVSYRTIADRLAGRTHPRLTDARGTLSNGVTCIPLHHTGFDRAALELLERSAALRSTVVIVGHPSGLSRSKEEGASHFERFIDRVAEMQALGTLRTQTVSENLAGRPEVA